MGLKAPFLLARIMTEQQISRTQGGWKVYDLKPSPSPLLQLSSDGAGMVARSLRSAGRPAGTNTAGLLQILSNLANDYGDAVKAAINLTALGRYAACKKGSLPARDETGAHYYRRAHLSLRAALVAVACHTLADFVGFLILAGCRSLPLSPTPWAIVLMVIRSG